VRELRQRQRRAQLETARLLLLRVNGLRRFPVHPVCDLANGLTVAFFALIKQPVCNPVWGRCRSAICKAWLNGFFPVQAPNWSALELMRWNIYHYVFTLTDGRDARLPTSIGSKILLRRESTAGNIRIRVRNSCCAVDRLAKIAGAIGNLQTRTKN
jgi:hypothetical protein